MNSAILASQTVLSDLQTTERGLGRLLVRASCGVLIISLLLQIWRPFFNLTDDSFTGYYPVAVEVCRALWTGHSITTNPYLYGGGFNMLGDTSGLGLWSPWLFIFSPIGLTEMRDALIDLICLGNSLVIAGAFVASAHYLRRRLNLAISDPLILIATLSYTFTPINLVFGASWIGFLNAQVVFPVLLAAAHARRAWLGVLALAAAFLYGLVGGHAHPTIMAAAFGGLLAVGLAFASRSWRPLVIFAAAGAVCLFVLGPLLASNWASFSSVARSSGYSAQLAAAGSIPVSRLMNSFFFGPVSSQWCIGGQMFEMAPAFFLALAFSLVSIPTFAAVGLALKHRRLNRYSYVLLALGLLTVFWIIHPPWVGFVHANLPLLKSLRWPMRECTILLFWIHALFLLHAGELQSLAMRWRFLPAVLGASSLALIITGVPPSLNPFGLDRELVLGGEAAQYWTKIRETAPLGDPVRLVVGAPQRILATKWMFFPMSLLGGYNFASLYEVSSVSGYCGLAPETQAYRGVAPAHWGGLFIDLDARAIYDREPGLTLVLVHDFKVPRWSLTNRYGVRWFMLDRGTGKVIQEPGPPLQLPGGGGRGSS